MAVARVEHDDRCPWLAFEIFCCSPASDRSSGGSTFPQVALGDSNTGRACCLLMGDGAGKRPRINPNARETAMSNTDFAPDALRTALRQAERGIRVNYVVIAILAGLEALVMGTVMRIADFSNDLHALIVLAATFLLLHAFFMAEILTRRQDAMNARMLRALELLDTRLAQR